MTEYQNAHYEQLRGLTIVGVDLVEYDDDGLLWPTLIAANKAGDLFRVEVSADPEGNGPGHLFIQDIPEGEYHAIDTSK